LSAIGGLDPSALTELVPLMRRTADLDPRSLVRVRVRPSVASALVQLPFGVLIGRRIAGEFGDAFDATFATAQLLDWLDQTDEPNPVGRTQPPPTRDLDWRGGLPPESGWRRVETVPDDIVRGLVRKGALTLKEAAQREGIPGAQPRAEVADALLDSVVLTIADEQSPTSAPVEVTLRLISAVVRVGFLARDSHLAIDVAGRWLRLAASYGSAYAERPGQALGLLR
jgi:hypothetical protein